MKELKDKQRIKQDYQDYIEDCQAERQKQIREDIIAYHRQFDENFDFVEVDVLADLSAEQRKKVKNF